MAWRLSGDKPLSEPMMARLPKHICVTRPQWVKAATKWPMFSRKSFQIYFLEWICLKIDWNFIVISSYGFRLVTCHFGLADCLTPKTMNHYLDHLWNSSLTQICVTGSQYVKQSMQKCQKEIKPQRYQCSTLHGPIILSHMVCYTWSEWISDVPSNLSHPLFINIINGKLMFVCCYFYFNVPPMLPSCQANILVNIGYGNDVLSDRNQAITLTNSNLLIRPLRALHLNLIICKCNLLHKSSNFVQDPMCYLMNR